MEDDDDD
jgi:hypothetical protein